MNFPRTFLAATHWPHRLGLCLLLLAVVLRGMVPAGYMPKQTDQGYALAFCLPSGQSLPPEMIQHWAALLGEDTTSHSDEATTSATCPFCVMLQAALTPAPIAIVTPLSLGQFRPLLLPPLSPALAQAFIRGPPVGQRAPPSLLPA
ncbi:DUF2946 family protein [Alcaligenes sp. DN25]|uniref:DUF2946 family protein n=1 Tax=Alcaligenes TaxID=507 RepID=UPI0007583E83|nr:MULTISPECIES: DUF2946 family protein [Alcaligenes]KVX04776.1 hypothetical protein ASL22_04705 [Alcaligenes faecalis]URW82606.1 DUF2946 family protein [Alcaligenes sp. DN25]UTM03514.1 DUF2946 family protein [Alcaligenes sp. NLF5-7]WEA67432.1 DUF2946 family protein [Alcaligenes faecalis]